MEIWKTKTGKEKEEMPKCGFVDAFFIFTESFYFYSSTLVNFFCFISVFYEMTETRLQYRQ